MENFVIDLDKVLDDFERSEDTKETEVKSSRPLISCLYGDALKVKINAGNRSPSNFYHLGLSDISEKIDLADADFSASSSSLSPAVASQISTSTVSEVKVSSEEVTPKYFVEEKSADIKLPFNNLQDVDLNNSLSCSQTIFSTLGIKDTVEKQSAKDTPESHIDSEGICETVPSEDPALSSLTDSDDSPALQNASDCVSTECSSVDASNVFYSVGLDNSTNPVECKQEESFSKDPQSTCPVVGFASLDDEELSNVDVDLYLQDLEDNQDQNQESASESDSPSKSYSEEKSSSIEDASPPSLAVENTESQEEHLCLLDMKDVKGNDNLNGTCFSATEEEGFQHGSEQDVINCFVPSAPCQSDFVESAREGSEPACDGPSDRLARPTTLNLSTGNGSDSQLNGEHSVREANLLNLLEDGEAPVLSEEDQLLGKLRPFWIPDTDAPNCMYCEAKFSFIKRRHHCRACGKVLCGQCCNGKAKLDYLENKESRVCGRCLVVLVKAKAIQRLWGGSSTDETPSEPDGSPQLGSPNPNNPQEYCSTVSPLQQVQNGQPPPTVMVPIGVLKRGSRPRGEPKQVMFSDGIRPGGDLTDPDTVPELPCKRSGRTQRRVERGSPVAVLHSPQRCLSGSRRTRRRAVLCDAEGPLPPLLLPLDYTLADQPDPDRLMEWLQDQESPPVAFAITKNLQVLVKLYKLDCCMNSECWCFSSRGMSTVGQDEFMVILERLPDENILPREVFSIFCTVYDNASKGNTVLELGNVLFPEGLLGSREHSGFLFVRPTLQCVQQLHLPPAPYLVALLIQKWEIPWAKVFPLRLLLRIGSEFRYYPCPLVSVRFRKPVFGEIGHTIMSVLADFRNYHYTLPILPGMEITMAERRTMVTFPRGRYNQVVRIVTNSNEHVLGFGGNFCSTADSHLVCVQTDDGNYQTQAINIQNTARKVTGASFIVFSGALKSSTGLTGKSSMVEDGLLIQIPNETMVALKGALRDMRDFEVPCGPVVASEPDEVVLLRWCKDDRSCNRGVKSVIDGKSLEGVESVRVHSETDYAAERHLIRWTEVFFLSPECANERRVDASKVAEVIARACCMTLANHLESLAEAEMTKIALRVTVDEDKVGYEVGARGEQLSNACMSDLDSSLIPVISGFSTTGLEGPILLELVFHVLLK